MEPINYLSQVADPFAQALQGVKIGAGMADLEAQRALAARQAQQQQLAAQEQARFFTNPNPTMRDAARYASLLTPEQAKAFQPFMENISKEQQQTSLKKAGQLLSALQLNPEIAVKRFQDEATAARNSGDEEDASFFERLAEATNDPAKGGAQAAFKALVKSSAYIPGAKEFFENIDKGLGTARDEALAPSKLQEQQAKAAQEVVKAENAIATAEDDVAKAKASRYLEEAKAKKEEVDAKYAVQTKLADLGFKQAQTNKFMVETRNLDTQGKMLSLDFQAALQGLPLPSKKTEGGGGAATEDERKAAGWLAQATNAYNNMLGAMYQKGKTTGAEKPGFFEAGASTLPFVGEGLAATIRGTDRQKFVQASSSLSEALLRAATGAGVNKDEAKQKLEELTPLFTDDADTRKQKLEAIPVYLESLKARAGRAAPKDYKVPEAPTNPLAITLPNGDLFIAPNQKAYDEFKRRAGL